MGEFDLIARFFKRPPRQATVGIGDDCAIVQPRHGTQLTICSDMLVEGRHLLSTVNPCQLGHKALAACGAKPLTFSLALALPRADEAWLRPFSEGLLALSDEHDCELIGGDTTQGPLNICITVFGEVPVVNGRSEECCASVPKPATTVRERHTWRCPIGAGGVSRHRIGARRRV